MPDRAFVDRRVLASDRLPRGIGNRRVLPVHAGMEAAFVTVGSSLSHICRLSSSRPSSYEPNWPYARSGRGTHPGLRGCAACAAPYGFSSSPCGRSFPAHEMSNLKPVRTQWPPVRHQVMTIAPPPPLPPLPPGPPPKKPAPEPPPPAPPPPY